MKTSTQTKLLSYGSLAGSILISCSQAEAQIIYVDVPDIALSGVAHVDLDLDNNGLIDFTLNLTNSGDLPGGKIDIYVAEGLHLNAFLGRGTACAGGYLRYKAFILESGMPIKDDLMPYWKVTGFEFGEICDLDSYLFSNYPCKIWAGTHDKFLGVRFNETFGSDALKYAWIRLSVGDKCERLAVKDWAYNNTVDDGIIAGYTGRSQKETTQTDETPGLDDLKIFGFDHAIHIEGNKSLADLNIDIYNMMGQKIKTHHSSDPQIIIPLPDQSQGVYVVHISRKEQVISKQIGI